LSFAKFNEIYTSDLTRAVQTTNEILSYHEGVGVDYTHRLREKAAGILEGKTLQEYKQTAIVKYC
jgi:broad specificity phosphatase PhoE